MRCELRHTYIAVDEDLVKFVLVRGGLLRVSSAGSVGREVVAYRDVVVRDNDLDTDATGGGKTPVRNQIRSVSTAGNIWHTHMQAPMTATSR